jgi:replicative DNA helicase
VSVERVAPQNLEAEESVLGAMMFAGAQGPEVSAATIARVQAEGLEPGDFFLESHRIVYEAALEVAGRSEPTDALAIRAALSLSGRLDDVSGGAARLHELAALVPAIANVGHYARLVVDESERREEFYANVALGEAVRNGGLAANPDVRERVARLLEPRRGRVDEQIAFVTFEEFVSRPEPQAEPLVLDAEGGTAVSATGLGMAYGTGGAGKTTLWLDGALHFAAGEEWLDGAVVPVRKLRVGWIENEGPREEFRRKLERKLAAWRGRVKRDRLRLLDRPGRSTTCVGPTIARRSLVRSPMPTSIC